MWTRFYVHPLNVFELTTRQTQINHYCANSSGFMKGIKLMTYLRMNLSDFDSLKFLQTIERKYGHTVARNVANDLTRLATIAQTNDYFTELNSPRFVARFKLHPLTGRLIVETINDEMKGYRYTCSPDRIHRHRAKY